MARTKKTGPVFNNYVTFRLLCRQAVGNNQTALVVDALPMPAKFRVVAISAFALGITNTASFGVYDKSTVPLTVGSGVHPSTQTLVAGTATSLGPAALRQSTRTIDKGNMLQLACTTDGTGSVPAGGLVAYVTGHFMEPISRNKYGESGQTSGERPVAGYYDLFSLTNVRANANQAARSECDMIVPYPCRVQAVYFECLGATFTTGSSLVNIRRNGLTITGSLDIDATPEFRLDNTTNPTFGSSSQRDFVAGDTMGLWVATGAADTIPIGTLTAHVLVWCKGHPRVLNAGDTAED